MKRKRLSVEQIVAVLKQAKLGTPVGFVNLTRLGQTGRHENSYTQLPTVPFSL